MRQRHEKIEAFLLQVIPAQAPVRPQDQAFRMTAAQNARRVSLAIVKRPYPVPSRRCRTARNSPRVSCASVSSVAGRTSTRRPRRRLVCSVLRLERHRGHGECRFGWGQRPRLEANEGHNELYVAAGVIYPKSRLEFNLCPGRRALAIPPRSPAW